MPGVTVNVGGKVDQFVSAMNTVEQVARASGTATAKSLREAEAAILAATEGTKLNVQQLFLYESALTKVRSELKQVEAAEIAAGAATRRAAEDRARAALTGDYVSPIKAYYERKKAQGGVNVYAPSGFGQYLKNESRVVEKISADSGIKSGKSFWGGFARMMAGSTSATSQIVSVISNTMSSLGSGMSPAKVLMQQGPNLLQSLTMARTELLALLGSVVTIVGSIGAIIAAPFIYFSRVSGIADKLSGIKLPDLNSNYVSAADRVASAYKRIAESIADAKREFAGATAEARRLHDEINAQFKTQQELDEIAKQRAITNARGNKSRIAEIEKQYEQLKIQRESERMDAERENKRKEKEGLEKELAQVKDEIGRIRYSDGGRRSRALDDLKAQYDAAKKIIDESKKEDGFFGKVGSFFGAAYRGGGLTYLSSPLASVGVAKTQIQMDVEKKAKNEELSQARQIVEQYIKVQNAEEARNKAIERRNKLISEGETKGKRIAELEKEIASAGKDKAKAIERMQSVAGAKAELAVDQLLAGGGKSQQQLTERERMGAYSGGGNISLLDVNKKQLAALNKILASNETLRKTIQETY